MFGRAKSWNSLMICLLLTLIGSVACVPSDGQAVTLSEEKRAQLLEKAANSIPPAKEGEDQTLSPYFFVLSEDPATDQLPLKSTGAQVNIAGVIANVKVTQVYKNAGRNTLEAIYIFPASTRAAVYAMKMTIGDRVIEAVIKERQAARQEYEQARARGQTASLLEQQRPNVFQMNLANILPGDEIKVELTYTELLVPENNVYEFVYPTVVGPRYSNQSAAGAPEKDRFSQNPTLPAGAEVPYSFTLGAQIRSGMPIAKVLSPSHAIEVEKDGEKTAHVALKDLTNAGNRDFVLRFSLAGKKIENGLLLYPGADENFFLLMMEPPERIVQDAIVSREYIFILDVSGSMGGYPLDTTKELMRNLLGQLRPSDSFNVMTFSGGSAMLSDTSLPATPQNVTRTSQFLDNLHGGGGTEIVPALKRALQLPRVEGTSRIMVVVTDGYVTVEKECFELIRKHLGEANLFAFGIGSSVNRHIIEGMARAGMGEPFVVLNPTQAKSKADKLMKMIVSPLMQGIRVDFSGFDAYDIEPLSVPDLFAEKPVVIFGKYRGKPKGTITVSGHVPGQILQGSMPLSEANISAENKALRYLWARHRIAAVADLNQLDKSDARVKEVTELGLRYSLLTEYTSFIAIDSQIRTSGKDTVTVKQPLPMPQGVSNQAVGGAMPVQSVSMSSNMPAMPSPSLAAPPMKSRAMHGPAGSTMARGRKEAEEYAARESPPSLGTIHISSPVIVGSLDAVQVNQILIQQLGAIKRSYEQELTKTATLNGDIEVELSIGADGSVKAIKILNNTVRSASLESGLRKILQAAVFPKPSSSTAKLTFKIKFSPV